MQEHDDITPAAWRLATLLRSHPWRVIAVIASVMLILGGSSCRNRQREYEQQRHRRFN